MKKRLLAMVLVLIMAFTLLPVSALALEEPPDEEDIEELLNNGLLAGKRWIDVVFHTADVADAGTGNNVWLMIEYVDGDVWGDDPDEIVYFDHDDNYFHMGATDSYKRLIPDKQIKGYTIAKKGNDDWYLHSVELDGYLYKFDQWLGNNARLNFTVGSYNERLRPLTVVFYTADEKDAGTDADVWMEIEYEDGTVFGHVDPEYPSENHVETPFLDNDDDNFERGDIDSFTFSIPDKPVRSYRINALRSGAAAGWALDQVEIDGVMYAGPDRKLIDNVAFDFIRRYDSYTITPGITPRAQDVRLTVETGDWDGGGTDADISVAFEVNTSGYSRTRKYKLDNPGNDFEAGDTGTYYLRGVPAGTIIYCEFEVKPAGFKKDDWDLESVSVNGGKPITEHITLGVGQSHKVDMRKSSNTGSVFSDINTGLIIGIGVPVIVIAAAVVVLVLRKKKKNSESESI